MPKFHPKIIIIGGILAFISACSTIEPGNINQLSIEDKFNTVQKNTPMLVDFLDDFPKGADLHNHASGAAYIEFGIIDAEKKGYFYDIEKLQIIKIDSKKVGISFKEYTEGSKQYDKGCRGWIDKQPCLITVKDLLSRTRTLNQYLDIVSVRGWHENTSNGQDHFFNAFGHAEIPARKNEYLASIIARNYSQGIRYVELMTSSVSKSIFGPLYELVPEDTFDISELDKNYGKIVSYLNSTDFESGVNSYMDKRENAVDAILRNQYGITIKGDSPDIIVRYIPQLYRLKSLHNIFINAAVNMKASKLDARIVAINMVQNEAAIPALANFSDQMKIFNFLWNSLEEPNIALHAGELVLRESPVEPMRDRISQSIIKGHATRIGHGISIGWESETTRTLEMMRDNGIAIEICLSSSQIILGVSGSDHPLRMYMDAGVPVTLATDDEGISRSNLTMEYVKAVIEHGLSYNDLKKISKNGLKYSFLDGSGIYNTEGDIIEKYKVFISGQLPSATKIGAKAYLQIRHERDIQVFERNVINAL